ncbi:DNA alkylation repair protein [Clostridium transplantifaecale]|uniref:DNA alkylation repair protein n=1 Tax=Clostridium transplantifaecale TaxID=2479838 RepID=UPI000F632B6C|nr:DNA alkylation repair protein [Clostridium transplantifaecale]
MPDTLEEQTDVLRELKELADEPYRIFQSRLIPGTENILGVRIPKLWKLARRLVKEEGSGYLERASDGTYEEIMLQGMVIGLLKEDVGQMLKRLPSFLAKANNWAHCDIVCSGLKKVKDDREGVLAFLKPYITSENEFEARFAVVLLLNYYIDGVYIDTTLNLLQQAVHPGYYVKMAVAWALSVCYVQFPEKTLRCMKEGNFEDFTYNKALQKITESYRVSKEEKAFIRSLKR